MDTATLVTLAGIGVTGFFAWRADRRATAAERAQRSAEQRELAAEERERAAARISEQRELAAEERELAAARISELERMVEIVEDIARASGAALGGDASAIGWDQFSRARLSSALLRWPGSSFPICEAVAAGRGILPPGFPGAVAELEAAIAHERARIAELRPGRSASAAHRSTSA